VRLGLNPQSTIARIESFRAKAEAIGMKIK